MINDFTGQDFWGATLSAGEEWGGRTARLKKGKVETANGVGGVRTSVGLKGGRTKAQLHGREKGGGAGRLPAKKEYKSEGWSKMGGRGSPKPENVSGRGLDFRVLQIRGQMGDRMKRKRQIGPCPLLQSSQDRERRKSGLAAKLTEVPIREKSSVKSGGHWGVLTGSFPG